VIELRVPPLRERRGDVLQLSAFILKALAGKSGEAVGQLLPAARQALEAYEFPGNVRELENILERAMAMCDGNSIDADDLMLPQRVQRSTYQESAPAGQPQQQATPSQSAENNGGLDDYISNLERTAIVKALEESRYNKTAAARKLGITFRALRYKLKKLGID